MKKQSAKSIWKRRIKTAMKKVGMNPENYKDYIDKVTNIVRAKAVNREICVQMAMSKRALTRPEAIQEVEETIRRLNVSYLTYHTEMLYMLSHEEQVRKVEYLNEVNAENEEKAAALAAATAAKTGWSEKRAYREMKKVQSRLGVDFESYDEYGFALLNKQEQDEKYQAVKEEILEKQQTRKMRNTCIWRTMWIRDIGRQEAQQEVEDTVTKLGISYQDYDKYELHLHDPVDKEWAYQTKCAQKKKEADANKARIEALMEEKGWTEKQIRKMYRELKKKYGCLWGEFFAYKLYELDPSVAETIIFSGQMKKLRKKYNRDRVVTRIMNHKELTNKFLEKYIPRKWCVNRDITFEEFKSLFDGEIGVVYKPNYGFQARGVQVMYFNGDMEGVYNQIMSYSRGVVEEIIKQHPDMKVLSPESVNCMRIVSVSSRTGAVLPDGRTKDIAYVSLKIGRNGNIVDNVIAGGMVAGVDVETGIVVTNAVNHDLEVIEYHPDTGTKIKGFQIPYFKEAIDLVYTVIEEQQLSGTIGWDMAIGENGPEIVEPNYGPGVSLLQDPYWPERRGMRSVLEKYYWEEGSFDADV